MVDDQAIMKIAVCLAKCRYVFQWRQNFILLFNVEGFDSQKSLFCMDALRFAISRKPFQIQE